MTGELFALHCIVLLHIRYPSLFTVSHVFNGRPKPGTVRLPVSFIYFVFK